MESLQKEAQTAREPVEPARVLVIEAHAGVRGARTALLDLEGFPTQGVSDLSAATQYLRTHDPPCLLLLDLQFGPDACERLIQTLKADPKLAAIAVVLLYSGDGALPDARAMGATGTLRKPMDPHLLLEM